MNRGTIKQVLSGDSVKIWGPPRRNGPPAERQLTLLGITAPKLERRPTNESKSTTKDEAWAWEAREFLRKKLVGQEVLFTAEKIPNTSLEKGIIYLGKDQATAENINELIVSEGLVTVRGDPKNPEIAKLLKCEEAAKAQGKGKYGNNNKIVREVHWTHERDVEKYNYRPLKAIIEHVRDGSTVRAFIMPEENVYYYITLMISGIRCSTGKSDKTDGDDGDINDQQSEAKYCVERHLLQRDCNIILMTLNNNNFIGSIIHPCGNIAELLLKLGFAKCVEWSLPYAKQDIAALREAEKFAKDKRVGIWKDYVPANAGIPIKDKEFSGVVIEIINGDSIAVKQQNGNIKKLFLSSIRPPKEKSGTDEDGKLNPRAKGFKPLYDIPWMFEARECLRKLLIGRKVSVSVDYIQPARDNLPEKTCCTVMIGKTNVAQELVSKGLAYVVRHRPDDDQRSSAYNSLLEMEAKAQKSGLGVHNTKESPTRKVLNISADVQKAKLTFTTLQRHDKQEAVVEFVTSGSRLRLFIPKDNCLITFLLSGISCPRGARPNIGGTGPMQEAEPYGEEALNFTKEKCMQRDVHITVQSMDKAGGFIGWLFVDNVNLSVALVREGLAQVHSTAERSEHKNSLKDAEKHARQNRLNIWKDYVETEKVEEHHEEEKVIERKINYEKIVVTDITPEGHFFAQNTEQGPKLEALMNKLHQEFSSDPPLPGAYTPKKGVLCAAKFSIDSQWYRAKIEKVQGQNVSVRYIDYGNREVIHPSSCAALPASFLSDKPYATEYALCCVNLPTDNDHRENALRALSEDLLNRPLLLNVETRGAVPEVTLMDTSNVDVIQNLISEGLLMVQKRREKRLQKILTDFNAAQEVAKKERRAIWEYGDITEDDN